MRGNASVTENGVGEPGKVGEPSGHDASLTLNEGEIEGRMGPSVLHCCIV